MSEKTKQIFNFGASLRSAQPGYQAIDINPIEGNEQALLSSRTKLSQQMTPWKPTRSFGLQSSGNEKKDLTNLISVAQTTSQYLNSDKNPIDGDGRSLINFDESKEWFFNNIHFVFALGAIVDDDDRLKMKSVLGSFASKPNQAYLLNNYQQLSSEHPLVRKIEEKYHIGHNNYHILLSVICSASDDDLKLAPIDELGHRGLITCATTWKSVFDIMTKYISLFGFIADYQEEVRTNVRDNMYNVSSGGVFDMKTKVESQKEKFEYNEKENMRNGQVINQNQRIAQNDILRPRDRQGFSLYDRIATDNVQETMPAKQVGGELKMNELYQPIEAKEAEFILYNDINAYDKTTGTNFVEMVSPEVRAEMPNFSANIKRQNAGKKYLPEAISVFPK